MRYKRLEGRIGNDWQFFVNIFYFKTILKGITIFMGFSLIFENLLYGHQSAEYALCKQKKNEKIR